jgi:hypothetical protein
LKHISKKEGARGMLPLDCFLLWGREGVILQAAAENKRIETKEDFNRVVTTTVFKFQYSKENLPGWWVSLFGY